MPRRFIPGDDWPDDLSLALKVFETPARVLILRELINYGPLLRADLIDRLGMQSDLVGRTLGDLEELGAVHGDLPKGQRHGRSVKYVADPALYAKVYGAFQSHLRPPA